MRIVGLAGLVFFANILMTTEVVAAESGAEILVSNAVVTVTRADFDLEMERVPEADRFEFLASRERIGRLLQEILIRKTLVDQAHQAGLDKSPQIVKKLAVAQEKLLATERVNHLEQEVKLPDFELRAKEIYKLNPEKFIENPTIRASHILISTKDRSKEAALKLAQDVHAMAAGGKDFGELAAKYSDDRGTKDSKGDLGYFSAESMVKPFATAAFAMKNGDISAPVETQYGFHLIQVLDTKPGGKQSYESVRAKIIDELKANYIAELKTAHIAKIREGSNMKVNEEGILKLKTSLTSAEAKK